MYELDNSAMLQLHTSLITFYLKMLCTHLVQTSKTSCLFPH